MTGGVIARCPRCGTGAEIAACCAVALEPEHDPAHGIMCGSCYSTSVHAIPQAIGAVFIARCPDHGLHGQRDECFDCNQPVDQIPYVPLAPLVELLVGIKGKAELAVKDFEGVAEPGALYASGIADGAAETCRALLDLLRGDPNPPAPEAGR